MSTTTTDRAQFLADIITTALEGGIGYWATATHYEWHDPDLCKDDTHGIPCTRPAYAEAAIFDREAALLCATCGKPWEDARDIHEQLTRQDWRMVHEDGDTSHEPVPRTMIINPVEVERALLLIADPEVEIPYMSRSRRAEITGWSAMNDWEGDSDDADVIAQVVCFDEVVYG